ncbi:MAG: PD-(D/E)XK nuclease family protein [Solirubrobacterales bacterium]|nr:PD-(D/E)XK nuclease family protein [Solirubrobacterales bacterium]
MCRPPPVATKAEALALARHIKETHERTGIKPSETAILFRTKTQMPHFAAALKQVGLVPYVVGGTGFWESREGVDLKALLSVIANPLDDDALIGVLAGPACGLSTDALLLLRKTAGHNNPLWPALPKLADGPMAADRTDVLRAERFVETIDELREHASTTPLGELVESAVTRTGYDLAILMRDPAAGGLANVRRIATLAADFEATDGRDLRGLLAWVELSARLDSEAAVATQEEDSDVVRLMTIHKAKGLEFELVCVADLGKGLKNHPKSVFWIGTDLKNPKAELLFGLRLPMPGGENLDLFDWKHLTERASRENTDEELRLFHVALTRAKRRLVISGIQDLGNHPDVTNSTSIGGRLATALSITESDPESLEVKKPEGLPTLSTAPSGSQIRIWRVDANKDVASDLSKVGDLRSATIYPPGGSPPLTRPQTPAYPNVPLSFSALNEYLECPAHFYAKRILRLADPPQSETLGVDVEVDGTVGFGLDPEEQRSNLRNEGTRFGSAIHELFELCAERRWVPPTGNEVTARLERHGVDLSDGKAVERASAMINGFIDSELGHRVKSKRSDIEIPLLVEIGEVTIRGYADLLIRDSEPPLILDYKTNRLNGKSPRDKMADYAMQRDLYGLAVAQALEVPVVETAFVFLEQPDQPVIDLLDQRQLEVGKGEISDLLAEIAGGHFFGGSDAKHQPCGDCWACERLASQIQRAREVVSPG